MRPEMDTNKEEFPVKVGDQIYGPISMERLVKKAYPMSVTFHKAIDITSNILNSIEMIFFI